MEKTFIICSKCYEQLSIPENMHIKFKCPKCNTDLEADNGKLILSSKDIIDTLPEPDFEETEAPDVEFEEILTGSFIDERDGKEYKTIKIGNQIWMAENLNFTGDNGFQKYITDKDEWFAISDPSGYCYYDYNSKYSDYGVLYQKKAALKACPKDWHLPTLEDIEELLRFLSDDDNYERRKANKKELSYEVDNLQMYFGLYEDEFNVGGKMKDVGTKYWKNPNEGANNISGFSAIPGGIINEDGSFSDIGEQASFWCSDYNDEYGYYFNLAFINESEKIIISDGDFYSEYFGLSVRCIKD